MKEIVEACLKGLQQKSYAEIVTLPPTSTQKVAGGRKGIILTIWKDDISDNEIQLVVQAYKPWVLGLGRMNAQGFRIKSSGESRSLRSEELYDFI
jgi:hypothetical protein